MIKKNLAVFQVLLLVVGILAIAYSFGSSLGFVSAQGENLLSTLVMDEYGRVLMPPALPVPPGGFDSFNIVEFFKKPLPAAALWTAVAFVVGGVYGAFVSGEVGEESLYWATVGAEVVGAGFGADLVAAGAIELLPVLGKKYMNEILEQREIKEFESFDDIKKRIQNLPFPEKAVEKRIFQELTEDERHHLFTPQGVRN